MNINNLQDSKCIIDGMERQIIDVDIHYNDANNTIPQLQKTLITNKIIINENEGIEPSTGARKFSADKEYNCRIESYNKPIFNNSGDTKQYKWVVYIPMNNINSVHHVKLYLR